MAIDLNAMKNKDGEIMVLHCVDGVMLPWLMFGSAKELRKYYVKFADVVEWAEIGELDDIWTDALDKAVQNNKEVTDGKES